MNVKVLFLRDVPGTAKAGDIREVTPGYARNYLFPKRLAVAADSSTVAQTEKRIERTKLREQEQLESAREAAQQLKKVTLTVYAKAGDGGRLFGAVTNGDIATQLKRETGLDIDKKSIEIGEPIKTLGPQELQINLHPDVVASLRVVVAAE